MWSGLETASGSENCCRTARTKRALGMARVLWSCRPGPRGFNNYEGLRHIARQHSRLTPLQTPNRARSTSALSSGRPAAKMPSFPPGLPNPLRRFAFLQKRSLSSSSCSSPGSSKSSNFSPNRHARLGESR
jgi:hypothetical protein